jgi:tripartite-type tricarboxylate transporter receptor subunit TctC
MSNKHGDKIMTLNRCGFTACNAMPLLGRISLVIAGIVLACAGVRAQDAYPNHPVRLSYRTSGVPVLAVPYRSIGQAFTDAQGGQIQAIFPGLAAAMPHVRSGEFKPLAVTGDKRHPVLPDVPTLEELGYRDFYSLTWYGIVGPEKMLEAITQKLNKEINKVLALPNLHATFRAQALNVMPMTSAQFGKYIGDEITLWTGVARASHIETD